MFNSADLTAIVERIAKGDETEGDISTCFEILIKIGLQKDDIQDFIKILRESRHQIPKESESNQKIQFILQNFVQLGEKSNNFGNAKDLGEVEYHEVLTVLKQLAENQSERVDLLPIVNPATTTSIDAVLEKQPHIFHFIGHGRLQDGEGEEVGEIALLKKVLNTSLWVDASFFSGLFNRYRPGIVLLQACESGMTSASQAYVGVASKIVQQNIPVVVAMQYEISNITACQFAYEFYEKLAQDEPVDIAAQNGRRTIALETQYRKRDFATPIVFMRVQDGYLFKRQGMEIDTQGNVDSFEGNEKAVAEDNTPVIQNVRQYGEKSMNFGQASNFTIRND